MPQGRARDVHRHARRSRSRALGEALHRRAARPERHADARRLRLGHAQGRRAVGRRRALRHDERLRHRDGGQRPGADQAQKAGARRLARRRAAAGPAAREGRVRGGAPRGLAVLSRRPRLPHRHDVRLRPAEQRGHGRHRKVQGGRAQADRRRRAQRGAAVRARVSDDARQQEGGHVCWGTRAARRSSCCRSRSAAARASCCSASRRRRRRRARATRRSSSTRTPSARFCSRRARSWARRCGRRSAGATTPRLASGVDAVTVRF